MEQTNTPLTKRPRASIACDPCRRAKLKCDGRVPVCERCTSLKVACVYTQSGRDRRMDRQAGRKTNIDLRNRVKELEARLEGSTPSVSQDMDATANIVTAEMESTHQGSDAESPVDVLAAGVFDHPSAGNVCYFGSSANHALFWSLTESIANLGHRSSHLHQEPLRPSRTNGAAPGLPQPPSSSISNYSNRDPVGGLFPDRSTALEWITVFFDTVGAVLPYVGEPAIFDAVSKMSSTGENGLASTQSVQALLFIVFAHALSTLEDGSPEPYYRQTLRLLDPKTLYVSSLELLQALLLLSVYQQNSQRSTESWTSHSLAVKTSYQLGIHAPSTYESLGVHEKDLRSRLWFAVVNQDRMLSSGLGQPCLVPSQYIRMEIKDMLINTRQNRTVEMSYSRNNVAYFHNLIQLHDIMGAALESIYGSNISSHAHLPLQSLITKTLELSVRLSNWRHDLSIDIIISNSNLSTWSPNDFESERRSILTSIFYYRTKILINGSLLMVTLGLATNEAREVSSDILRDTIQSVLKDDLSAVTELHRIIRGVLQHKRSFLKANAIWWTCNYASLTICLHLFAFWVASSHPRARFLALGVNSLDLETQLRACLDTLKAIGVASAMSVKAHRCLLRHLHFLSTNASTTSAADAGVPAHPRPVTATLPENAPGYESVGGFMDSGDLFGDLNMQDFVNNDLLGMEFGVSDFDATGLI